MSEKSVAFKGCVALVVLVVSSALCFAGDSTELSGQVLDANALTPLSGARVLLLDTNQKIHSSDQSDQNGSFTTTNIPIDTYQIAVEFDGTIYSLDQPLEIDREASFIRIAIPALVPAVTQEDEEDDDDEGALPPGAPSGLWSNPGTAAGLVVGGAFLLGWVIDSVSDDTDPSASPSTLPNLVLPGRR